MKKLPVESEELAAEKGLGSTADGEREPTGEAAGRRSALPLWVPASRSS